MILPIVDGSLLPDKPSVSVNCWQEALQAPASKLTAEIHNLPGSARKIKKQQHKANIQMQAHLLNSLSNPLWFFWKSNQIHGNLHKKVSLVIKGKNMYTGI